MDAVHALPVQFSAGTVYLCPIYNDLPVFSPDPCVFKSTAAYQSPAQPAQDILELLRIHLFEVPVDGLPVREFLCTGLFSTQLPYIFNHGIGIQFFTCFPHAADVEYRGKDTGHKEYDSGVSDITLMSGVWELL